MRIDEAQDESMRPRPLPRTNYGTFCSGVREKRSSASLLCFPSFSPPPPTLSNRGAIEETEEGNIEPFNQIPNESCLHMDLRVLRSEHTMYIIKLDFLPA
jgi:hypothetical protein